MEEQIINVLKEDYNDLILTAREYNLLLDAVFNNAKLDWSKKELTTDGTKVMEVVKLINSYRYDKKFKKLDAELTENLESKDNGSDKETKNI